MEESDESDDFYVAKALREEPEALGRLVERHYEAVYRFGFKLGQNEHDAQDITQETFLRAARYLAKYKSGTRFKSWLFGIAVNVSREMARKRGRYESIESDEALHQPEVKESHPLSARFGEALRKLPVDERSALVLVYEQGYSHRQAARICNCAESTISWRLHLARRSLKKWMTHHE